MRYPTTLHGIPLSERTQQLLYTPVGLLMNPQRFVQSTFQPGGWAYETFVRSSPASYFYQHHLDQEKARRMAETIPGSHVVVNGAYAYVEPKRWDETLFGFRLC